jgi:hypothetical protein
VTIGQGGAWAGGWDEPGVLSLVLIQAGTPGSGLFVYSGAPAGGNLIYSVTAATGTDPFGNSYLAGETSYNNAASPSPIAYNLNLGSVTWYTYTPQPGAVFTFATQLVLARNGSIYGLGMDGFLRIVSDTADLGQATLTPTDLGILQYVPVNTAATADGNTYTTGHLILPSAATPASPQTINSTAAAAITPSANVGPAAYRVRAEIQYTGSGAAGVPNFQVGVGGGAAATIIWGDMRFHDAVAGTSGYVARPTSWSPFAAPTMSVNNWMATFEGYALFTSGGTIVLQAWTSVAADTYQIKNAVLEVIPV